jgi:pimeloyl-ACP methyl ester carboxylesterase
MRNAVDDLRGAARLVIEATTGVTTVVEEMHRAVAGGPAVLGRPLEAPARLFTRPVYDGIRWVTGLVGQGVDRILALLVPLGDGHPGPAWEAVLAAVNGVVGDHLAESGNPLAIEMQLRYHGEPLELEREALREALPDAGAGVLVLIHGSSMSDRQWERRGHDHGAALERDLGFTPVYLQYNSGLHISTNGRALAALLERLAAAWPVPLESLAIVGHSMGGLVARSACHYGADEGHVWRAKLRKLVCIGSPHHGSHLERWGNRLEAVLRVSRFSAPLARLGRLRSAGVTDLRFGNELDEHWQGHDRFALGSDPRTGLELPAGVDCYVMAATTAPEPGGKLPGDGLVPVDSALGRHPAPELDLDVPETNQWVGFGMGHGDLLGREDVYETLRRWLSA